MMKDSRGGTALWQRWLGPGLMLVAILPAVVLLLVAADETGHPWIARAYVLLAIAVAAAYLTLVFIPERRRVRAWRELERAHEQQKVAVRRSLEELRFGDLVAAVRPVEGLESTMRHDFAAATQAVAGLIQQIQTSSVEVATSALTVHETAAELASGSSQQAAAVVEITATMEELARTAAQIATNAAGQAELAAQSEEAGNEGAAAVESAVAGVEAVRQHIVAISTRADTLGTRSREIYRVLELINEIAQETHILSLNAAIEAAAAGEHGDRFSVVADEVRRLAQRSRESVESVRTMLDEFSEAIRAVVVATEEGSKAADQVLQLSRSTEDSIDQLTSALSDTARTAREISLATQEQQTASDQVVLTLKEVSEVIQRMADGLKQFTGTAERLNQLALSIQLLTQSFRLDSVHSVKHQVLQWTAQLSNFANNLEAVEGVLGELLRKCPYLELIYLVDTQGVMVSFVVNRDLVGDRQIAGTVGVGQAYSERPWFQAVVRDHRTAVTPPYESLLTGGQCFTIAAAVLDLDDKIAGVLGADVNVRNWTRI
jgi:methyl-accepting chemotaxis protein